MFQVILADAEGARYETTFTGDGNPLLFANEFVARCEYIDPSHDVRGLYRNVWLVELNKI